MHSDNITEISTAAIQWFRENHQWCLSGLGASVLIAIARRIARHWKLRKGRHAGHPVRPIARPMARQPEFRWRFLGRAEHHTNDYRIENIGGIARCLRVVIAGGVRGWIDRDDALLPGESSYVHVSVGRGRCLPLPLRFVVEYEDEAGALRRLTFIIASENDRPRRA